MLIITNRVVCVHVCVFTANLQTSIHETSNRDIEVCMMYNNEPTHFKKSMHKKKKSKEYAYKIK